MKYALLIIATVIGLQAISQDALKAIRSHYTSTNKRISACGDPDACDLYQNKVDINSKHGSWPGVGTYSKKITFWYSDDPSHCDECGVNGINTLQKVEIKQISDMYESWYEILYKNGQLVFYYLKKSADDTEYRYYFAKGELIRYMKNDKVKTGTQLKEIETKYVTRRAANMQKLFLASHK